MMHGWLVVVALGASASAELQRAIAIYNQAHIDRALEIIEVLDLARLDAEEREAALMHQAFCYFIVGRSAEAASTWRRLLEMSPTFTLDPVATPPELLAFFNALPRPRPPPAAPPKVERAPDTVAEKSGAAAPRPQAPLPRPRSNRRWRTRLQRSRTTILSGDSISPSSPRDLAASCGACCPLGWLSSSTAVRSRGVFAGLEAALLATNIALYWQSAADYDRAGYYPDVGAAERNFVIQEVALGLLVTTMVIGVIDALVFYDE